MRRRTVRRGSVELAVFEAGESGRPTVLCVHGYPDDHTVWDDVVAELTDRFHVVAYDVRGSGTSSVPHERSAYRAAELRDDLAAVIDAVSPELPVHLVGHDWGSVQAWEAVNDARLRSRIASFTSMSGPCLDHFGQWIAARRRLRLSALRELAPQLVRSWYIGFFQLPVLPVVAAWSGMLGAAVRVMRRAERCPQARVRRRAARWGIEMYRANADRTRHPGRRRTEVPVQVLIARGDAYITPALAGEAVNWAAHAWRRTVAAGHWAPRSHPRVVARQIAEFADHIDGAPAPPGLARARIRDGRAAPDRAAPDRAARDRAGAPTAAAATAATTAAARADGCRSEFADRLVLVTGAGDGIGRATTLAFARCGAEVVSVDIDAAAARATADRAEGLGVPAHHYEVDVADGAAMAALAEKVRTAHGVPDIVVNNAGIAISGPFLGTEPEELERIVDVNLWGVLHGTRLFGGLQAERGEGGHIVNIASAAAYAPSKDLPAYATTKAAVLMLDRCVRPEFASYGIGVTTICPGFVATSITRRARFAGTDAGEQERIRRRTTRALGVFGARPERVARRIVAAVRRDQAVVLVTPEAHALSALSRLSPAALRAVARAPLPFHAQPARAQPSHAQPSRAQGARR